MPRLALGHPGSRYAGSTFPALIVRDTPPLPARAQHPRRPRRSAGQRGPQLGPQAVFPPSEANIFSRNGLRNAELPRPVYGLLCCLLAPPPLTFRPGMAKDRCWSLIWVLRRFEHTVVVGLIVSLSAAVAYSRWVLFFFDLTRLRIETTLTVRRTTLRYHLSYHTPLQIIVGAALGFAFGIAWAPAGHNVTLRIARVFQGVKEPDDFVKCEGTRILRDNGIAVYTVEGPTKLVHDGTSHSQLTLHPGWLEREALRLAKKGQKDQAVAVPDEMRAWQEPGWRQAEPARRSSTSWPWTRDEARKRR
ncbi:hypothetical protein L7F22_017553 [Adiantum nelumboides]|nr:hypothetical protein [Adiantum nelumboides]